MAEHQWKKHYFSKFTWCSFCNNFIVGVLKKQGYKCTICKAGVHGKCRDSGGPCPGLDGHAKSGGNPNNEAPPPGAEQPQGDAGYSGPPPNAYANPPGGAAPTGGAPPPAGPGGAYGAPPPGGGGGAPPPLPPPNQGNPNSPGPNPYGPPGGGAPPPSNGGPPPGYGQPAPGPNPYAAPPGQGQSGPAPGSIVTAPVGGGPAATQPGPPAFQTAPATPKKMAKALFDFPPENLRELELKAGDMVEVVRQEDEWWFGTLANGNEGFFPFNYVEKVGNW